MDRRNSSINNLSEDGGGTTHRHTNKNRHSSSEFDPNNNHHVQTKVSCPSKGQFLRSSEDSADGVVACNVISNSES